MENFSQKTIILIYLFITIFTGQTIAEIRHNLPDGSKVILNAVTDSTIHVRYVPASQVNTPVKHSLIVPDLDHPTVPVTTKTTATTITLQTPALKVQLNKNSGKGSFYNLNSKLILSEADRSATPFTKGSYTLYKTSQSWNAPETEAYYGLGQHEHAKMNYQGQIIQLEQLNKDAVSPFVLSSGGYGILWDINCTGQFNAAEIDTISFNADAAFTLEYYFMFGPDYDKIISQYRILTGTAPMFPRWAYGYMQSKERYVSQNEVLETATKFRNLGFPIDLIIQDWRYWGDDNDKWSGMTWDPGRFPDPTAMIDQLHNSLDMKFMAVIWPFIGTNTDIANELEANNCFFDGSGWIGPAKLYKAYDKTAQDIYWKYANKELFQRGLDSWWMDGSEPEDVDKYSGDCSYGPIESCHNAFSLIHTQGIYQHQRQTSEAKRVMILTRSSYAGQQRTAGAAWSGDITASWKTLSEQITAGINFSMSGLPYWTTDIGAFFLGSYSGNTDPAYRKLYTRWFQFGTFCPLFRSHGTNTAREPWHFGNDYYPILLNYTNLRYRLMPYIYTLASEVTRDNSTIMRGLPMAFPADDNCRDNGRQFMFGPSFMVCPVIEQQQAEETIPSLQLKTPTGQTGLKAEYFSGRTLSAAHKHAERVDPAIDFNWSTEPIAGLGTNNYTIRWQGKIIAQQAGIYEIGVLCDDGARLWIDNNLVIDQWKDQAATYYSTQLNFQENSAHDIKLEYYQGQYDAVCKLLWAKPANQQKLKTDVYLPQLSAWYDFWTGDYTEGGKTISKDTPIDIMPLYVKAGSIIPMAPKMQYATEKPADPIELRIYPGKDASFTIYEDENDNYNYESGSFSLIPIQWNDSDKILTIGERTGSFPGMIENRTFNIVLVRSGHGIGIEPENKPDHIIKYNGTPVTVNTY